MSVWRTSCLGLVLHVTVFIEAFGFDEGTCTLVLARLPIYLGLKHHDMPLKVGGSWVCLQ